MKWFPRKNILWNILFWGGIWVLIPLLFLWDWEHFDRFSIRSLIVLFAITAAVWINMEVLLPRLFFQKKQGWYVLAGSLLIAGISFLVETDLAPWADYFNPPKQKQGQRGHNNSAWAFFKIIGSTMPYMTAVLGSAFFEIASFAYRKEKEAAEFRTEKLDAEIKFLKSQINPHFLFNALNNIYAMTVIKSDKAPDHLLKLSGMLRYMLYDCKADKVPLYKEIEYLRHFIDLHLLKDSRGLNVKLELDDHRSDMPIAPMLFIPFVENAFKHSKIEDLENGWISIRLATEPNALLFEVKNSLPKEAFTKDKASGIGLQNVRRQLELLYPDQHELGISQTDGVFFVNLKIYG
jgi:hypothetical protein